MSKKFYSWGQENSGADYFYTLDHLASVREMTDSSGVVRAEYIYDPYGRASKLSGISDCEFQYGGYYLHSRSGLELTLTRAYNPERGRFLNRDTIEEAGGINLYQYVGNAPIEFTDPSGTDGKDPNAPKPICNYKDCMKWCMDTGNSIPAGWARTAFLGVCFKICRTRFPPPPPTPVTGGTKKPNSWIGPQTGNAFKPPIVPIPIPGTSWTWPGVETPIGPLPIVPVPVGPVPVPI
ncbi:MAG: RHS repeat-associated core domain-containing protein [Candidatus Melainabacteria bacterium]|nr:RHS repeat-associated core domain-containing protein [Candidatus Melainabacteria bacterium]